MSMGMEKDLRELAYGTLKPKKTLWFSLLHWIQSGNAFPVMEVHRFSTHYPGFHSLGSSSKLKQSYFSICSSWATNWICKYVINSKGTSKSFWWLETHGKDQLRVGFDASQSIWLDDVNMLMLCLLPDVVASYWIHLIPCIYFNFHFFTLCSSCINMFSGGAPRQSKAVPEVSRPQVWQLLILPWFFH